MDFYCCETEKMTTDSTNNIKEEAIGGDAMNELSSLMDYSEMEGEGMVDMSMQDEPNMMDTINSMLKVARWLDSTSHYQNCLQDQDCDDTITDPSSSEDESESDSKPLMMDKPGFSLLQSMAHPDENKRKALAHIFGRSNRVNPQLC